MRKSIQRLSIVGLMKGGKSRKALANPNDDYQLIKENTGLDVEQIKQIQQQFNIFAKNGNLNSDKVFEVLSKCNSKITQEYKKQLDEEIGRFKGLKLDLLNICNIYVHITDRIQLDVEESNNAEYIDAFVAMGGNADRTGTIERNVIIDIIKITFELTFDIETFMSKQEVNSQHLDFLEFCTLFDQNMQESRSIISGLSRKYRENNNDIETMIKASVQHQQTNDSNEGDEEDEYRDGKPLEVNYKDFQKWMLKEEKSFF